MFRFQTALGKEKMPPIGLSRVYEMFVTLEGLGMVYIESSTGVFEKGLDTLVCLDVDREDVLYAVRADELATSILRK